MLLVALIPIYFLIIALARIFFIVIDYIDKKNKKKLIDLKSFQFIFFRYKKINRRCITKRSLILQILHLVFITITIIIFVLKVCIENSEIISIFANISYILILIYIAILTILLAFVIIPKLNKLDDKSPLYIDDENENNRN